MGLSEYTKKRHFGKTPEPEGTEASGTGRTLEGFFCVQRHDATRLHYDFRLEVGGVLVSWAIPKGPSLDPARKSLAMKVEDHPLDYGNFEGNIPKGEYGGGSVMLWDRGEYRVIGDVPAEEQLERGDFKFELHGEKLGGTWAIVHMKTRAKPGSKGNEWLLLKKKDDWAVAGYDVDEFAWSVLTKRTQDQIATGTPAQAIPDLASIEGSRKAPMPEAMEPMLATAVTSPPPGPHWTYEIKWDGVRALCAIDAGKLQIFSRRANRADAQYPELHNLPKHVSAKHAWLDGEICVLNDEGRSRFELIQPRIMVTGSAARTLAEKTPVTLFLFDVLYVDGYDLRGAALDDRRDVLRAIVTPGDQIRISETFETDGESMFEAARQMKLEGILAKDRRSKYEGTRSTRWQKMKVLQEQEFVIAGFTKGAREYFAALVLGLYDGGKLRHAGQVGTGFDGKKMKAIYERLKPFVQDDNPLADKKQVKDATWVKPQVVCQVRFLEWTDDGCLRAPVFVALRNDKDPAEVRREGAPEPRLTDRLKENSSHAEQAQSSGSLKIPDAKEAALELDGHRLKFTNLQKVFFPKDGCTKRDVLDFYAQVAPYLLPHLHDRPLSLKRYPNGIAGEYFFQKNASPHFPEWMRLEAIVEHGGTKTNHYPLAQDEASLLYLVNLGCIDHNPLMSRIGSLDKPDWMLLDLDPVDVSFDALVDAALLVREVLDGLGLAGYPKTTGGDGMHVYVPLDPIYSFDQVRSFAELLSHLTTERAPKLFTTPRSVNKREKGRVYFDYLQIGSMKTIAAPYVIRAHDGAPVATPLAWHEVKRGLQPSDFTICSSPARFREKGDLFAPVLAGGQRLEDALERLHDAAKPGGKTNKPVPATKSKRTTSRRAQSPSS